MVKVSVVIPNWNGLVFLDKCLSSLKRQSYKNFEVIIIDNGSGDGSIEFIERSFPQYRVIKIPKNIGVAAAFNRGIKESIGDYIIFVNNDTELNLNCLRYMVEAAEKHPEVGMVAAKMINFYKRDVIDSAGDYVDVVGHADGIGRGEKDGPKFCKPGYVFSVTGGGGLFKREVFQKVGLFDADYFAYMEDVDLCLRAGLAGYKAWFEPRAKIYHIHKATSSKRPALLEYWQFRNMSMTIIKDFPRTLFLRRGNLIKILLVNLNTVRYLFLKGYGVSALRAELYVLLHLFTLLKKRKYIQSRITVNVSEFIVNFRDKKLRFPGCSTRF